VITEIFSGTPGADLKPDATYTRRATAHETCLAHLDQERRFFGRRR
jgi:hypothetical protein